MAKCTERARITLPWGGQVLNYCPVHANEIAQLGQVMGSPVKTQLLSSFGVVECECLKELTEEEKALNKEFKPSI